MSGDKESKREKFEKIKKSKKIYRIVRNANEPKKKEFVLFQ